jgi:hypothetical protein
MGRGLRDVLEVTRGEVHLVCLMELKSIEGKSSHDARATTNQPVEILENR